MSPDTLVVVCGYAGDAQQIHNNLPYYLHHKAPVLVLSPLDAPVFIRHKDVVCKSGGKRAYIGQDSLDRQLAHMRLMLDQPFQHFLAHDSDSVVLSSRLPGYLYAKPNQLWSNVVSDAMHDDKRAPDYKYPHLAFQPPYFFNRHVLERLIKAAEKIKADPNTPFIDWAMMAWCVEAGIPYENYPDGCSCPSNRGPGAGYDVMYELVRRHGRYILHSIKDRQVLLEMANARLMYLKKTPYGR